MTKIESLPFKCRIEVVKVLKETRNLLIEPGDVLDISLTLFGKKNSAGSFYTPTVEVHRGSELIASMSQGILVNFLDKIEYTILY